MANYMGLGDWEMPEINLDSSTTLDEYPESETFERSEGETEKKERERGRKVGRMALPIEMFEGALLMPWR